MKTEKKKSKESLIGKIIYGFLLFMPLLSVLVTCLYVIQDDNAHESYYGKTINEEQYLIADNVNENTTYYLEWANLTSFNQSPAVRLYISNFEITNRGTMSDNSYEYLESIKNNINYIILTQYNSAPNIQFGGTNVNTTNLTTTNWTFSFNLNSYTGNFTITDLRYIEYNKYSYLDDAFMYGLQKTEESQYFNWAKNTALYTGVNEFTNALGITTTYIPFLMTYWLLISVVYLIYDIALMMIHMAHNKIHQLEGSI